MGQNPTIALRLLPILHPLAIVQDLLLAAALGRRKPGGQFWEMTMAVAKYGKTVLESRFSWKLIQRTYTKHYKTVFFDFKKGSKIQDYHIQNLTKLYKTIYCSLCKTLLIQRVFIPQGCDMLHPRWWPAPCGPQWRIWCLGLRLFTTVVMSWYDCSSIGSKQR